MSIVKGFPNIPADSTPGLAGFLMRVREVLEVLLGVRGSGDSAAVLEGNNPISPSGRLRPRLKQTAWEDLRFPAQGINPPGATSDPDKDGDGLFLFDATGTEILSGVAQLPHAWAQGTSLHAHVHWSATDGNTGDVAWQLEYKVVPFGEAVPSSWSTLLATGEAKQEHCITEIAEVPVAASAGVSALVLWRLSRAGGNPADTYGSDAKLYEFDFHYQVDAFGSDLEYSKE
jgi:hypothetical protein